MDLLNWKSRATLTHTVTAAIALTANDWQIYAKRPGADAAAERLNKAFNDAVNVGKTRNDVYRAVHEVMVELNDFGTTDGEPADVLSSLLSMAFPKH